MEAQRKVVVDVCAANNLMPKDGEGSASTYVQVDFGAERRRTKTIPKDLNPSWEESFEFTWFTCPDGSCDDTCVEVNLYHDMRCRTPKFMGRVCVPGSSIPNKGEEVLTIYNLERRGLCSQVKGTIAMKVCHYTDEVPIGEASAVIRKWESHLIASSRKDVLSYWMDKDIRALGL